MYGRERIVLGSNFWNSGFSRFAYFEIPWIIIKKKNQISSCWCVSVWVHLCLQTRVSVYMCIICITQKQVKPETRNLVFYICIICISCLKLFMNIGQNACIKVNSETWRSMDGTFCCNIRVHSDSTTYNEINIHFWHSQKLVTNILFYEYRS